MRAARSTTPFRTAIAVAVVALIGALAMPGSAAADEQSQLNAIQARERAVTVQLNLARANDAAVLAEAGRLNAAVTAEEALVAADASALAAATARVSAASQRIAALTAQGQAARQALVDRAINLYEHPFQNTQLLLDGVQSLDDLTTRQVLANAVQARTSDLVDAVRQQRIQEEAAARELTAAQADVDARHRAEVNEYGILVTAAASAEKTHAALQARINDEDQQIASLAGQAAQLQGILNARAQQYIAQVAAANAISSPVLGPVGSYHLEWPIHGIVTQEFGHNGHPGIDIAAPYGAPIVASGSGVVIYAGWESGYGNYTCISHGGGISTCYGHQSFIAVVVGQTVTRGEYIGREGSTGYSTGPHVHFEVRVDGVVHNPRLFIPGNP